MPRQQGAAMARSANETSSGKARSRAASGRSDDGRLEPIGAPSGSKSADPTEEAEVTALAPGLYIVATPIGNLRDITLRALDVLRRADAIICEDTRVTATLARRYGLAAERIAYHDHNADAVRPKLLARLAASAALALVSDAGTPLISDPGFKLVREAVAAGIAVTAVPGASAAVAAVTVAGLPTDRFLFAGFLPIKSGARRRALRELATVQASLVFYETAPRLGLALADMAAMLGDRLAAVARELTKLHEEVRRESLAALAEHYRRAGPPKGEIVVVVGPPPASVAAADEDIDAQLLSALRTASLREATAAVAAATGLPRRQVYARALALQGKRPAEEPA
jgi:16S rRNA (cytidine1402-2'-O)-methyltransferase